MKELALKIYAISRELIVNPRAFWKVHAGERESREMLFKNLLYPLVAAAAVAVFFGEFFRSDYFRIWIGFLWAVREVALFAALYFGGIYITTRLTDYFGYETNTEALQRLVAYSMIPFLVISIFTGLFPFFYFLDIFGVYSFYIFLMGGRKLLLFPKEQRDKHILIIIAVNWIIFGILSFTSAKLLLLLD